MKYERWLIPETDDAAVEALMDAGYPYLVSTVLASRGVITPEQAAAHLDRERSLVYSPFLMRDMDKAVARIDRALAGGETIAVFGDYDVDGITSTCLLTDYLRSRGAAVLMHIPRRIEEGYGLGCDAIRALAEQGVTLIVTVDCGITGVEETAFAATLGVDLVITDHHECKDELPAACAVVDPHRPDCGFPFKHLAGVGVALELVLALGGAERESALFSRYCTLAAIGTIADVMRMEGENRTIVQCGLEGIDRSDFTGLHALLREAGLTGRPVSSVQIGFVLAPRINAAGRMGRAELAAELLLTQDPAKAERLARELCDLNRERQSVEQDIFRCAIEQMDTLAPTERNALVLSSEEWHQGVVGIVASRLSEKFSCPSFMIHLAGGMGKGSCRSYGGFNLFEALSACAKHLTGFGGHALAAGLNISRGEVGAFRAALAEYYRENRPAAEPEVHCDLLISDPAMLSIDSVRSLDQLEPYGNANPRPTLCVFGAELESADAVGGGRHLRMRVRLRKERFEAIFFSHTAAELGLREGELVDLAFTPQINEFRGHVSVQFVVSEARPHDGAELCAAILAGDEQPLYAAAPFCPDRADFVRIWRGIQHRGFTAADDAAGIIAQTPHGMEPERFCICLMVLLEVGLLSPGSSGGIFGAVPQTITGKADLEGTRLIRLLRSI